MLAYMEKKYKEHFAMVGSYGGQLGKDYAMVQVRSRNRLEDIALVRITYAGENNIYQDNYLAFLLRDEITQKMGELAEPVYGECKVFYKVPNLVFPTDFGPEMDADTFLRRPEAMTTIYIYPRTESENSEEQIKELTKLLEEKKYCMKGVVRYPEEDAMYEAVTEKNFFREGWRGCRAKTEFIFSVKEDGSFKYVRRKGEGAGTR